MSALSANWPSRERGKDREVLPVSAESLSSYGKVHALGHREIATLFDEPVVVEEKVDGSQFSFGVIDGELRCRSRGQEQSVDRLDGMFLEAIAVSKAVAPNLNPGWTYRGEYLRKPRHNVLAYERIPAQHIILFDIQREDGSLLSPEERSEESQRLGFEPIPVLLQGKISSVGEVTGLLETVSVLGRVKIEGLVFKRASMKGKFVSERFKEIQRPGRKVRGPKEDPVQAIGETLRTDARWEKAVQHLREAERIVDAPQDIGPLMRELARDITEECEDLIKEQLFALFKKDIVRIASNGFPEWYKQRLAESQFGEQRGES